MDGEPEDAVLEEPKPGEIFEDKFPGLDMLADSVGAVFMKL